MDDVDLTFRDPYIDALKAYSNVMLKRLGDIVPMLVHDALVAQTGERLFERVTRARACGPKNNSLCTPHSQEPSRSLMPTA